MRPLLIFFSLLILFSCNNDSLNEINLTGDFINTYHLKGSMILYDSGLAVDTIIIDEAQTPTYGSFGDQNLSGFIGTFTGGVSVLFGVSSNEFGSSRVKAEMLPSILNKETYPMISLPAELNEDFMSASLLFSGPDKNYNYDVIGETIFTLDSIYLSRESVFQINQEIETVTTYVGNFDSMLKLSLNPGDTKKISLPDSIKLHIESVKGFLH